MIDPDDRMLTPPDLAELLRINRGTLYAWRRKGFGPPAIRVGGQLRWRRADVDEWVAKHWDGIQ